MASQITHIALADKVFTKYFSHFHKKEFYVGTVFPDIRYLGVISRDETHVYEISLAQVQAEKNSFEAGLTFHALIDLVREDFLEKAGLYSILPEMPDRHSVPKLLEDILFYSHVTNWPEIIGYFEQPLEGELVYGISAESINAWHISVSEYFKLPPNDQSRSAHALSLRFSQARIDALNENVASIAQNQEIIRMLTSFYDELEPSLENWR